MRAMTSTRIRAFTWVRCKLPANLMSRVSGCTLDQRIEAAMARLNETPYTSPTVTGRLPVKAIAIRLHVPMEARTVENGVPRSRPQRSEFIPNLYGRLLWVCLVGDPGTRRRVDTAHSSTSNSKKSSAVPSQGWLAALPKTDKMNQLIVAVPIKAAANTIKYSVRCTSGA